MLLSKAMANITKRVSVGICAVVFAASGARGEEVSRVRTESTYVRAVLAEATQYSPTVAALIHIIGRSNVIAHVECGYFKSVRLEGRTIFVLATSDVRYVRVQVDCLLPHQELIAIVGHELQHVAEIAATPDVVDEPTFARLLGKIGFRTSAGSIEQYETEAAILARDRVSQEINHRRSSRVVAALTNGAGSASR